MSNYAFTSPEKFKEMTFHISQITNKKVSVIRHEIAKKEGFDSVEAYLKCAFESNFPLPYNVLDSIYMYADVNNGDLKINVSRETDRASSDAEAISLLLIGNDTYLQNAWATEESDKYIADGFMEIEEDTKEEIKESVKYFYENTNSAQKYLFNVLMDFVFEDLEHETEVMFESFEEDIEYEYEAGEAFSIPNDPIIYGAMEIALPNIVFKYYDSEAKGDMMFDESFTTKDMTAQAIADTYQNVMEQLMNKVGNIVIDSVDLKQKVSNRKMEEEDILKSIRNIAKNEKLRANLFYDYVCMS